MEFGDRIGARNRSAFHHTRRWGPFQTRYVTAEVGIDCISGVNEIKERRRGRNGSVPGTTDRIIHDGIVVALVGDTSLIARPGSVAAYCSPRRYQRYYRLPHPAF